MSRTIFIVIASLTILAPATALGDAFDGSKPLSCYSMSIRECDWGSPCLEVLAEAVDGPELLEIDVDKKQIEGRYPDGSTQVSPIERMESIDGKLMLQGAEDGRKDVRDGLGWTIVIAKDSGRMVLSASGDDAAFVIFGACVPR